MWETHFGLPARCSQPRSLPGGTALCKSVSILVLLRGKPVGGKKKEGEELLEHSGVSLRSAPRKKERLETYGSAQVPGDPKGRRAAARQHGGTLLARFQRRAAQEMGVHPHARQHPAFLHRKPQRHGAPAARGQCGWRGAPCAASTGTGGAERALQPRRRALQKGGVGVGGGGGLKKAGAATASSPEGTALPG